MLDLLLHAKEVILIGISVITLVIAIRKEMRDTRAEDREIDAAKDQEKSGSDHEDDPDSPDAPRRSATGTGTTRCIHR